MEAQEIQKMNFSIGPKNEAEQEEQKARIEIAKATQHYSTQIALKGTG